MIDLPQLHVGDVQRTADWVEACVLLSDVGVASQTDAADRVRDAGLLGTFASDVFEGDETYLDEDAFAVEDAADRFAEDVWQVLADRKRVIRNGYPFQITGDLIERTNGTSWRDLPAFTMLLISDLGRHYREVDVTVASDSSVTRLFEKVVEASQRGLLRGSSCRFGWPIEPGWPKPINERIEELASALRLDVEDLAAKTQPGDKDRGLDVATRLSLGDDGPGTIMFLTQCAVGANWKKKQGEPSITEWQDVLKWNCGLVRAVAVPWRLEEPFDYRRAFRHFDGAVVFDRMRLCAGQPDRWLSDEVAEHIVEWCEPRVASLPAED